MHSPVRRSLLRRITWMGGDRRIVGFFGLVLFMLAWTFFNGFGLYYGLSIAAPLLAFIGIVWVARMLNNSDPWMIDVASRSMKYRNEYTPHGHLSTMHPQIKDFH